MNPKVKIVIAILFFMVSVPLAVKLYTHEKNQSRAIMDNILSIQNIEEFNENMNSSVNEGSVLEFSEEENAAPLESLSAESYYFDLSENKSFLGNQSDDEMGDYCLHFKGGVTTPFSSLTVGKGKNVSTGCYLTLTEETLKIFAGRNGKQLAEYEINFEIKDYVSVMISADLANAASIEISTNGNHLIIDDVPWRAYRGKIFAESDDSLTISNCILSYYAKGWNKPVWLFGDSYFNPTSSARWTSYLTKNGYANYLLNGWSGRESAAALLSLKTELQYATPKEIIWCMGMNDADNGEINESWLSVVNELMEICENRNIILVLATIPTNPAFNNDYKNEYVKISGYRYIDFAQSVGAYENIEWYDGMLEDGEQRIHPTSNGALALYNEAVATCPELCN